ncbi:hypothetical protein IJI72_01625 [Candidatus Saccharibacteria bacterium]|nr:hypothetical protein [Candidatus Saccharibacteria bacterium]
MGFVNRLFPGTEDTDDFVTPETGEDKKRRKNMKPEDWRKVRRTAKPADDDLDEDFESTEDVEDVDDAEDASEDTTAPAPGTPVSDLDEDFFWEEDDADEEDEALAELHAKLDAQQATINALSDQVNALNDGVNKVVQSVADLTVVVNKLLTKPVTPVDLKPVLDAVSNIKPAATTSVDLTPVLDAVKNIKPADPVVVDLSPLLQAIAAVPEQTAKLLPTATPATAQATLEEVIDRDLDLQAFRKEVEGYTFGEVYDLNGKPKSADEVSEFFGDTDPAAHGLKLRVAKFQKGNFVEWSDARHLRAYELLTLPATGDSAQQSQKKGNKKPASATAAADSTAD